MPLLGIAIYKSQTCALNGVAAAPTVRTVRASCGRNREGAAHVLLRRAQAWGCSLPSRPRSARTPNVRSALPNSSPRSSSSIRSRASSRAARASADALAARRADVVRQHASARARLTIARRAAELSTRRLEALLRRLYEQRGVDPLEVLLGSRSLDEALTDLESLDRAAAEQSRILERSRATRTRLLRLDAQLAAREAELESLTAAAEARAGELAARAAAKATYVAKPAAPAEPLHASGRHAAGKGERCPAAVREAPAARCRDRPDPRGRPCRVGGRAGRGRRRHENAHGEHDRLQPARNDGDRAPGRTRHRRGRSERDPARHPLCTCPDTAMRWRPTRAVRFAAPSSTSGSRRSPRRTPGAAARSRSRWVDPAGLIHVAFRRAIF